MNESANGEEAANLLKDFFKRWPRAYYFIYDHLSPMYFGGLSPIEFLGLYSGSGINLNLGSGARRIASNVKNVDIRNFEGVDILADISNVPFKDNTVDSIISTEVLEHVNDTQSAVKEIKRILVPGGYAYITIPLLYPFHASPSDYYRWTHVGIKESFREFEVVDIGVRSGPFSTLTVYLAYLLATLLSLGSTSLYWVLVYFFSITLSPIKLLDVVGNRLPFAINLAAVIYCVVRKPKA